MDKKKIFIRYALNIASFAIYPVSVLLAYLGIKIALAIVKAILPFTFLYILAFLPVCFFVGIFVFTFASEVLKELVDNLKIDFCFEDYAENKQSRWNEQHNQNSQNGQNKQRSSSQGERNESGVGPRKSDLALLGLTYPFTAEELRRCYRIQIKKAHPDAGGSEALAAQINAAHNRLKMYA